jgi:hypothetical protein
LGANTITQTGGEDLARGPPGLITDEQEPKIPAAQEKNRARERRETQLQAHENDLQRTSLDASRCTLEKHSRDLLGTEKTNVEKINEETTSWLATEKKSKIDRWRQKTRARESD